MTWYMQKFLREESQESRVSEAGGRGVFANTLIPINSHQLRITPLSFITGQLTLGLKVFASLIVLNTIGALQTSTGPQVRSLFLPLMTTMMKPTWMRLILISKMGSNSMKAMKIQNEMSPKRNNLWLQHLPASQEQVITLDWQEIPLQRSDSEQWHEACCFQMTIDSNGPRHQWKSILCNSKKESTLPTIFQTQAKFSQAKQPASRLLRN